MKVGQTVDGGEELPWKLSSPGEIIKSLILLPYGLTQGQLAERLSVSRKTINELVSGKRGVSADMALRLSRLSGRSARFWLELQLQFDLQKAMSAKSFPPIEPLDQSHKKR